MKTTEPAENARTKEPGTTPGATAAGNEGQRADCAVCPDEGFIDAEQ